MKQLLSAIAYMHSLGVLHMDLKPENILCSGDLVKLADLGCARGHFTSTTNLSPHVGTTMYKAPEIILESFTYSTPVDIWSLGCVFGELVNKEMLFFAPTPHGVFSKICGVLGTPNDTVWPAFRSLYNCSSMLVNEVHMAQDLKVIVPGLSAMGIDLLSKMLQWDPARRITAADALNHPYFSQQRVLTH